MGYGHRIRRTLAQPVCTCHALSGLPRPFVQVPRIVTALCAEKFALLSSFCLHFMPRRGLSLEVRVSPYNTVCVGGDLPRLARSVATALTPGATPTEGDRPRPLSRRRFRPRSGL